MHRYPLESICVECCCLSQVPFNVTCNNQVDVIWVDANTSLYQTFGLGPLFDLGQKDSIGPVITAKSIDINLTFN